MPNFCYPQYMIKPQKPLWAHTLNTIFLWLGEERNHRRTNVSCRAVLRAKFSRENITCSRRYLYEWKGQRWDTLNECFWQVVNAAGDLNSTYCYFTTPLRENLGYDFFQNDQFFSRKEPVVLIILRIQLSSCVAGEGRIASLEGKCYLRTGVNIDQFQHEICFVEFNQSTCDVAEWRSACRRDTESQGEFYLTNFGIYFICVGFICLWFHVCLLSRHILSKVRRGSAIMSLISKGHYHSRHWDPNVRIQFVDTCLSLLLFL